MGLMMPYELHCACGKTYVVKRYDYVFADDFPEVKEKILNGEFFVERCPGCGGIMNVENRFLYRDERHRLWVWVCKSEEKGDGKKLKKLLLEGDAPIKAQDVYGVVYRRKVVFGRDELLALLLREDRVLQKEEDRPLKKNAAIKMLSGERRSPGCLFLNGDRIKMLSLPLRESLYFKDRGEFPDGGGRWLDFYAQGLNIHNPYSSFLSEELRADWNRIRRERPIGKLRDEYDDFSESYAAWKINPHAFREIEPARWAFLDNLKKKEDFPEDRFLAALTAALAAPGTPSL